jgi:glycosyltransferase involved in cell wall biosynthesis
MVLPNVVDEEVWRDGVAAARRTSADRVRAELGVRPDQQLWVCPARLEWFKGLVELMPLLRGHDGFVLAIAGEGSLRGRLEQEIATHRIPVRLLGHCEEPRVQALYAAGDLFVLPSVSDANPLSAIEAIAAGLPLWLSRRCGNAGDVLVDGVNGWLYDPETPEANLATLRAITRISRAELAHRGRASFELHRDRFETRRCVEQFVAGLAAMAATRVRA